MLQHTDIATAPDRSVIAQELGSIVTTLEHLEAEQCRRHFALFVRKVWSIIEPDKPLSWNKHLDILCAELERFARDGNFKRLLVNVPPGTMKTILILVMFPAWVWASSPGKRFFAASYAATRTIDSGSKLKKIVESDWYQEFYALELSDDQNNKVRFNTEQSGWYIASSVGGIATGEHPDFVLIDDPITEAQSRSDVERTEANTWFSRTISSRGVGRGVKVCVVMQRLHQDDLSGYILTRNSGAWEHICFPMRYVPTRPKTEADAGWTADPRDWRTTAGELLWPDLFSEATTRQLELDLGPYGTAGQLKQTPAPEGGGLFKREWFKFVDVAPKVMRRVRGWDTAATEGAGDETSGVKIGEYKGSFFIEDCVSEQVGPAGQDALMLQTAQADGIVCSQREEKEGGASGVVVVSARLKLLKGFDYKHVVISTDKVMRSKPFRAQVEGGNVYIVRGPWNESYIRQLTDFPTASKDDKVDASSCAFNAVLLEPEPEEEWFAL